MWLTADRIHLLALALTLAVETTGIYLWMRLFPRAAPHTPCYAVMIVLFTNLLVHTLFWQLYPHLPMPWPWSLYLAEAAVVLGEGLIYRRVLHISLPMSLALSFLLNLASLVVGLLAWNMI